MLARNGFESKFLFSANFSMKRTNVGSNFENQFPQLLNANYARGGKILSVGNAP